MTAERTPTVLVLGGNRFAGARFVELLVSSGAHVTTFHRTPRSSSGARVVQGDRNQTADLWRAFEVGPDVVVDMSAYTGKQVCSAISLVREIGCRYVAMSSAVVYDATAASPCHELAPLGSAPWWGRYGAGKVDVDLAVTSAGLANTLVLRPPYFVGHGDPDERCQRIFERASRGMPIEVPEDGQALLQVVDVDDVAAVLLEATYGSQTGVVNLPGSEPLSVTEFTEACAACVSDRSDVRFVQATTPDVLSGTAWPFPNRTLCVSSEEYRRAFGYRCRSASEAITRAFQLWRRRAESHGTSIRRTGSAAARTPQAGLGDDDEKEEGLRWADWKEPALTDVGGLS